MFCVQKIALFIEHFQLEGPILAETIVLRTESENILAGYVVSGAILQNLLRSEILTVLTNRIVLLVLNPIQTESIYYLYR